MKLNVFIKRNRLLDCYIEIHVGVGGTESQDCRLRRMYMKWSDNKKFRSHLISEHKGRSILSPHY